MKIKERFKNIDARMFKISVLGIVLFTFLAGGTYLLYSVWNKPLNPALELTENLPESSLESPTSQPGEDGTSMPGDTPQPTTKPVCGGPPSMTVLITGVASKNYLYGLADAIRVARIDFQTQEVTILALPRDLWVEIPGLESRGITVGKLNQAYFYGTEGMGYFSGSGYGSGLLAETLLSNYGLRVDHYLSVNLSSFQIIIDTLGGIDIYLTEDVYKRVKGQPELFLKAGSYHLDGKKAEILARTRIEIGDFGRINNQTVILKGIAAKMLTPSGIKAIPDLVSQLRGNVMMDLSPDQISQLACLAGRIDYQQDVSYETLPVALMNETMVFDPFRNFNTFALVGDTTSIRNLLEDFQAGIWP